MHDVNLRDVKVEALKGYYAPVVENASVLLLTEQGLPKVFHDS